MIYFVFYDSFEAHIERLNNEEFKRTLEEFHTLFKTNVKFYVEDNGVKSLLFIELDIYQDFVVNYFNTFLFIMFAPRVNILITVEKNKNIK
jgi:hypothetical protein